jgi:hypothetical protein
MKWVNLAEQYLRQINFVEHSPRSCVHTVLANSISIIVSCHYANHQTIAFMIPMSHREPYIEYVSIIPIFLHVNCRTSGYSLDEGHREPK